MNTKSQFYLSQCADAASKSTMYFRLGSVIVKGGKVISTGFNHQRPNYDTPGNNGRPVSMHAEMASIFKATRGAAPALKQQVQPGSCAAAATTTRKRTGTKAAKQKEGGAVSRGAPQGFRVSAESEWDFLRGEGEPQGQEAECAYESGPNNVCPAAPDMVRKRGRARCPKLNGCDLYVCRITKNGEFGCSKPCWRCVDWCAWAGIRRIFHWSMEEGQFICLKVRDASQAECYETMADVRFLKARALL
ncbi:hypothetical protein K438DRAFT_1919299 [Mycena galopus ATCC 62051]|nr:hypothetical protein K438DRAFT_1919299 [Mycena galopus ATCC 62051]